EFFRTAETELGLETRADWVRASIEARSTLAFIPMAASDMDDYIKSRLRGGSPAELRLSEEVIVATEKKNAEEFAAQVLQSIRHMSIEELSSSRIQVTLALALNHMFAQNNDAERGIPLDVLKNNVVIYAGLREALNTE